MSTKAIREALEFWARNAPGLPAGRAAEAGLVELEAIEKAAKVLDDNLAAQVFASNPEQVEQALDLLESIAKQEP